MLPLSKMIGAIVTSLSAVRGHATTRIDPTHLEVYHRTAFSTVTALAFLTRFYRLSHPSEVVFDEAHILRVGMDQITLSSTVSR